MNQRNRLICLFALLIFMLVLPSTHASAALVRCRVDPIFVLSNGDVVAITADIYADPSRVGDITYTLRVPFGVTVKEVVHTARGFGIKEIYKVYQNSPAQTYITESVVTMQSILPPAAVTISTRLNGVSVSTISGYSGQHLLITIKQQ